MNDDGKVEMGGEPMAPESGGDEEARIRERAYLIWIEEGMPEGDHERHWHLARTLVMIEDAGGTLDVEEPAADPADDPMAADPAADGEPAEGAPLVKPARGRRAGA